ncbi:uncharacterized protein DEA37_0003262, partial [Paragonimus westermani]
MYPPAYVRVSEGDGCEAVEVPLESDQTLLLPTLTALFPKCTGLKYKSVDSGCFRGLRLAGDHIYPPNDGGWEDTVFYCVFPKGEVTLVCISLTLISVVRAPVL